MKLIQRLSIIALFALTLASATLSAADFCSASATACGANCSISAPPGGGTQCFSGFNFATCVSFDANGNQVGYQDQSCFPGC